MRRLSWKRKKGKYLIKYSSGAGLTLGEIETDKAIDIAREAGANDPDLLLVEITTNLGGCVIDWRPQEYNGMVQRALAFLYSKLRRLIVVGRALGLG